MLLKIALVIKPVSMTGYDTLILPYRTNAFDCAIVSDFITFQYYCLNTIYDVIILPRVTAKYCNCEYLKIYIVSDFDRF